jgi:N-acetylmuramoyl-L-alanine amidase
MTEVLPTSLRGLSDMETLALTIYGEARGEPIEGQIAVGCVIRNRALARKESYKEVCLEPKQFSCWNENDPNYSILSNLAEKMLSTNGLIPSDILKQCLYIAVGIINGAILDNTNGSNNYMTTDLYTANVVNWAREMKVSAVYGRQTFLV